MADHSQTPISKTVALPEQLAELGVLPPTRRRSAAGAGQSSTIAVCPSQRAAMVYLLDEQRPTRLREQIVKRSLALDGVELAMWLERDSHGAPVEAAIAKATVGELRFAPGGELCDDRSRNWSVEGELAVLEDASVADGRLCTPNHPDALARVWAALLCPNSGDVLLSTGPGGEFLDLGGQAHVGGGSHGSLRAEDSLGALIVCGTAVSHPAQQWAISDVAGLVTRHFGV